jgi:hypothetical protein
MKATNTVITPDMIISRVVILAIKGLGGTVIVAEILLIVAEGINCVVVVLTGVPDKPSFGAGITVGLAVGVIVTVGELTALKLTTILGEIFKMNFVVGVGVFVLVISDIFCRFGSTVLITGFKADVSGTKTTTHKIRTRTKTVFNIP